MREEILKNLKGTKKEKIERIENMTFQLDMVDRWSREQSERYNLLFEIKKEIEKENIK